MAIPTGLVVAIDSQGPVANSLYARFVGYGTYTAADFTIGAQETWVNPQAPTVATQLTYGGLGFNPKMVKVLSLTTGKGALALSNGNLTVKGYTQVAAGDKTPTSTNGISMSGKSVTIDVSVAGIATNDDFVIECWG